MTLAIELGSFGIRANAVAPGTILSPRMEAAFTDEQRALNSRQFAHGQDGFHLRYRLG